MFLILESFAVFLGAMFLQLTLNAGDRVDLVVGENPLIYIYNNGASLYGFLIQRNG
jgi:hypothetical protein